MDTLLFRYALEVAQTQSITHAAENLNMSQPNLSKAIKDLEKTLGIQIFLRSTKGVTPTDDGKIFLEYAENVLAEVKKMEKIALNNVNNNIKICIPNSISYYSVVLDFLSKNKDVTLNIDISSVPSSIALNNLIYNKSIISVIRILLEDEQNFKKYCVNRCLECAKIMEFKDRAVISEKNFLATTQILTDDTISNMFEIARLDENLPYHINSLDKAGKHQKIYLNDLLLQIESIKNSQCYFMKDSPVSSQNLKNLGLKQVRLESEKTYIDFFVYRKGYALNLAEKLFLDCISSMKNEIYFS